MAQSHHIELTPPVDGQTQPITGPIDTSSLLRESEDHFKPADTTLSEMVTAALLADQRTEYQLGPETAGIKFKIEAAFGSELSPRQKELIQTTRESYQKLWSSPFVPADVSESIIWNAEDDESGQVLQLIVESHDEVTDTRATIVMRIFLVDINPQTQQVPSDLTNWEVIFHNKVVKNILNIFQDQLAANKQLRVGICSRLASQKTQNVEKEVSPTIRQQRRSLTTATAYALMTQEAQKYGIDIWSYTVTEELIESVLAISTESGSKIKLPFQTTEAALNTFFGLDGIQQVKLADNEEIRFLKRYFAGYWLDPITVREILERFKTEAISFSNYQFVNVIIEYFIALNRLIVAEIKHLGSVRAELLEIQGKFITVEDIILMLSNRKYMHFLTPLFIEFPELESYLLAHANDGCLSVTMSAEAWSNGLTDFFKQIKKLCPAGQEQGLT